MLFTASLKVYVGSEEEIVVDLGMLVGGQEMRVQKSSE
jgi:hypothetical protein